jgi:hypothetical protein
MVVSFPHSLPYDIIIVIIIIKIAIVIVILIISLKSILQESLETTVSSP